MRAGHLLVGKAQRLCGLRGLQLAAGGAQAGGWVGGWANGWQGRRQGGGRTAESGAVLQAQRQQALN